MSLNEGITSLNSNKSTCLIKDAIAFLLFSLLLVAGCWTLLHEVQTQFVELISAKPLIVLSSFHAYLPGALFALVFMTGYAANRLWRGLRRQRLSANNGKLTAIGVLTGLALVVIGNFVINAYWQGKAGYAGYQPCPALTLLTNRITMQAWSKNEALCFNTDVQRVIVWGKSDETRQLAAHLNTEQNNSRRNSSYSRLSRRWTKPWKAWTCWRCRRRPSAARWIRPLPVPWAKPACFRRGRRSRNDRSARMAEPQLGALPHLGHEPAARAEPARRPGAGRLRARAGSRSRRRIRARPAARALETLPVARPGPRQARHVERL